LFATSPKSTPSSKALSAHTRFYQRRGKNVLPKREEETKWTGFNARPTDRYVGRASTQVLFLRKPELGFFHILEIAQQDGLVTFRWTEDPSTQPATKLPPHKIPLTEKRFVSSDRLQKGAENTKEKIQAMLYVCIGM
jgi:hypothetical protein